MGRSGGSLLSRLGSLPSMINMGNIGTMASGAAKKFLPMIKTWALGMLEEKAGDALSSLFSKIRGPNMRVSNEGNMPMEKEMMNPPFANNPYLQAYSQYALPFVERQGYAAVARG